MYAVRFLLRRWTCLSARAVLCVALGFAFAARAPSAYSQPADFYPGKNVDTIGAVSTDQTTPPNPRFTGDPDKKQQNEPSCDISPNNSLIVFCGMNDYRGVDRVQVGEPWMGAGFTTDGGETWKSMLHPGFKGDLLHPPLGFMSAADPTVRVAPGIAVFNFIAFNPNGTGGLFVSRWYERSREDGFPYEWLETIKVAEGTAAPGMSGRFLDKPAMTISLAPSGSYSFIVPAPTPANPAATRVQKVPAGVVHLGYAVFTGNSQQDGTRILYRRSFDYGKTWENPTVLSESRSINQAVDLAVDATNPARVVAIWRRFGDTNERPAMMTAVSNDGGRTFSKAAVLREICPFDQGTSAATFRTSTHPAITFDGTAFHAFWSARNFATADLVPPLSDTMTDRCMQGEARIVRSSSTDGVTWTDPQAVDDSAVRGHQFQPAAATSGNRILLAWFDTRTGRVDSDDVAFTENGTVVRRYQYLNDYLVQVNGVTKVRRRTGDIRAAEAIAGTTPPVFGASKQVSRYQQGLYPDPRYPGKYPLERNKLNPRLFKTGTVPFHGDYIAAATQRFTLSAPGAWVSSAGRGGVQPIFHLAWTDNRLVRGDVSAGLAGQTPYTPPPIASDIEPDPALIPRPVCEPTTVGTRDQSVFAARVYPGLIIAVASAPKQVQGLQRAYALYVRNTTEADTAIRLSLTLSGSGVVSFNEPNGSQDWVAQTYIDTTVPARSSIARTVYIASADSRPAVRIEASVDTIIVATAYINGNPDAAPIEQPIYADPDIPPEQRQDDISYYEVHDPLIEYRATLVGAPAIDDPAIDDPAIDDPAIDDPAIDDPAIDDPAIDDPAIDDPAIDDAALSYENPAIDDPAIDDSALTDRSSSLGESKLYDPDTANGENNADLTLTQITWKVALKGNTTTSMTGNILLNGTLPSGVRTQLLVSRRYRTSDIRPNPEKPTECLPVRLSMYQVLVNIPNPAIRTITFDESGNPIVPMPDTINPPANDPSFFIPTGGAAYMTLRIWGLPTDFSLRRFGMIVSSQPGNPDFEVPHDIDLDVTPPTLVFPDPSLYANVEGNTTGGANVEITVTATDNGGTAPAVECLRTGVQSEQTVTAPVPADGTSSFFPLGTWQVTCTAEDAAGNQGSGEFAVVVRDTTTPTLDVSHTTPALTPVPKGATLDYALPTATDIVDAAPVVACTPAPGTFLAVGPHVIVCTATDASGNVAEGRLEFTVVDGIAPILTVPAPIIIEATGPNGAQVSFTVTATDDLDTSVSTSCVPASGAWFPIGPNQPVTITTVNCTATDGAGNTGAAAFTVTVRDTTPPVLTGMPSNMGAYGPNGGAVVAYTNPTAIDLVSGSVPVACTPSSGSTFPTGTTLVTCVGKDGANNQATGTFNVTVSLDDTLPTITDSVTPSLLWPPDGTMVPVNVSGTATDPQSGVARIQWSVEDEYGQVQPSGSLTASNGPFSFTIMLLRDRRGNDKDGRKYTITVTAFDGVGNAKTATPLVVNVHDQSK